MSPGNHPPAAASLQRNWRRLRESEVLMQGLSALGVPSLPALAETQIDWPLPTVQIFPDDGGLSRTLVSALQRACVVSDYLVDSLVVHGDWLLPALVTGCATDLEPSRLRLAIQGPLEQAEAEGEDACFAVVRRLRREYQCRLVWRDLVMASSFETTLAEITMLAEVMIDVCLDYCQRQMEARYGVPRNRENKAQRMVVLGLGKLGAGELNLSSDIDLIFAFPESGETDGRRALDNQTFFVRTGQQLIQLLDRSTADGFVFRVDMRLRPWGASGALALSFDAIEDYYEDHGRDWERYAFLKARAVAGDVEAGEGLLRDLVPFVYRKYIDFSAIESLRTMKALIVKDVLKKGLTGNIKLGAGGIREAEFIVQAFQLVRGGRERHLRRRSWLRAIEAIDDLGLMPSEVVGALRSAYLFLRRLEHALQGLADRQTQTLPSEPEVQARIAVAMNFADWPALWSELEAHRAVVTGQFDMVIVDRRARKRSNAEDEKSRLKLLWEEGIADSERKTLLEKLGYPEADLLCERLSRLRDSTRLRQLQAQGRERVDRFMPLLLEELVERRAPLAAMDRALLFVETVCRRTAYLLLLIENPAALGELVRLFCESRWISEQIIATPLLLDELLHSDTLYNPPAAAELKDELRQILMRIPADGLEEQMDALRYFKKAHVLRVAASEIRETLPLMKVSDYLTAIAETLLQQVLNLSWAELESRYGRPLVTPEQACDPDFAIIGYGKLGGIELSYESDLDIVFLHGAAPDLSTNGPQSIENQLFLTRLGQRIIHLLSTRTAAGAIYEVDMRLRPSGSSGMLVSSLAGFRKYQLNQAWTWEHQALVRARCVAGCERVRRQFEEIRKEVLCLPRDPRALLQDVLEMREKMRVNLSSTASGRNTDVFALKQDPGGIVDIEFMCQYMAIRAAPEHPEVVRWSDNIRILEALAEANLIAQADADGLAEIYRRLRSRGHQLALQGEEAIVPDVEFEQERAWVQATWDRLMTVDLGSS